LHWRNFLSAQEGICKIGVGTGVVKAKGGLSMPQQVKRSSSVEHRQTLTLNEIFWRDISEPGAYVEVGSGDLYRFPKEALTQGLSPLVRKESAETPRLVKISDNPYITSLEARMICAEHNIAPNF
jgi:hypothetical protein